MGKYLEDKTIDILHEMYDKNMIEVIASVYNMVYGGLDVTTIPKKDIIMLKYNNIISIGFDNKMFLTLYGAYLIQTKSAYFSKDPE